MGEQDPFEARAAHAKQVVDRIRSATPEERAANLEAGIHDMAEDLYSRLRLEHDIQMYNARRQRLAATATSHLVDRVQ
ncbi:hypothetical protein BGO17_03780 [Candidatus Saccharibacteria bacterium 49-20]|nr:MAG: hypothetical protein BGO17_03780 [Candidatus Saccharibacteria bacterium 49-20]